MLTRVITCEIDVTTCEIDVTTCELRVITCEMMGSHVIFGRNFKDIRLSED